MTVLITVNGCQSIVTNNKRPEISVLGGLQEADTFNIPPRVDRQVTKDIPGIKGVILLKFPIYRKDPGV